ncbi:MAG: hypothetical protein ACKOVA_05170 [Novosphingobium sp.]
MEDDTLDLVIRLATRIGMIMEDASPIALRMAGQSEVEVRSSIEALSMASGKIAALMAAIDELAAA